MLELVHNCDLEQTVKSPTRESNILDLFQTNRPTLVNRCEVIPGISDHEMVYIDSNISAKRQKPIKRKITLWKRADLDAVRDSAHRFSTELCDQNSIDTPVEELWSAIASELSNIMDSHVPSKMASTRFSLPWVNRDVKTLKRRTQRYYKQAINSKTDHNWKKYKEVRRKMQFTCREAYRDYMSSIVCADYQTGNKNKLWSYVKSLRKDNSGVAPPKKGRCHAHRQCLKG